VCPIVLAVLRSRPMFTLRRLLLLLLLCALPLHGAVAASRLCLAALVAPATATAVGTQHAHLSGHAHDSDHASAHAPSGAHSLFHHGHAGAAADDRASDTCSLCAACCLTVAVAPQAPDLVVLLPAYVGHGPVLIAVLRNVADGLERPPRTV
jgi:hypothetical protein